ncbi:hypothetical protein BGZ65_007470 [Modicella reniformis]|uniref:site-specific DNA-methyltransferase (adenine-specific) n=1 Tax=Modicella reniformis TaxID=1440133 RepID=A0A9P6J550_9FUNG|nr:hypothetical protein BGZ65_007470 [Modicella reniformis]
MESSGQSQLLALMTAFVSVVCWVMHSLLDTSPTGGKLDTSKSQSHNEERLYTIDKGTDMNHDDLRDDSLCRRLLQEFLNLFDDQDNVLKPISDALAESDDPNSQGHGVDSMKHNGLFAWHYHLFASDPEGPLVKIGQAIPIHQHRVDLDVILSELYTTHFLSKTAKKHQKDHGQFYTPPAVVEFMWERSVMNCGNLLDRFVKSFEFKQDQRVDAGKGMESSHPKLGINTYNQSIPLIPTALDPCLGVSTFLSSYIRLLIREAQDHNQIWTSEKATRSLLHQICEHVWGIELDGFVFWMARCGILAALMPLVQRVQELSRCNLPSGIEDANSSHQSRETTKLPRLHLFRSDTLQLTAPVGNSPEIMWERECILQLRKPSRLQFDFVVTNPPYMIRKTGTFSTPDPDVYDWTILDSSFASVASPAASKVSKSGQKRRSSDPEIMGEKGAVDFESGVTSTSTSLQTKRSSVNTRSGAKKMKQAYGYFIWFAVQRVKPYTGVTCMITASQWLTLEFAANLRRGLFENCLMDEFFQFESLKVFSRVQTDSLIFKIRTLDPSRLDPFTRERALKEHRTTFLRHMNHRKQLIDILKDYKDFSVTTSSEPGNNDIKASSRSRQELSAAIEPPIPTTSSSADVGIGVGGSTSTQLDASGTSGGTVTNAWTYSFAPMMPITECAFHLLSRAQYLGGICSKRNNPSSTSEPLSWHRGPNTNPVYGLVVRMEYARDKFGEAMTQRWFKPALYWNGKYLPEGFSAAGAVGTASKKVLHKEGVFWLDRDPSRLSKKEGSPAESYRVPTSDPRRLYALCMVDKNSIKVLKQQVVDKEIEKAEELLKYLVDVRKHFQPGLASKGEENSSEKRKTVDDEGVACCSTSNCGLDVQKKIVHPINYGYFSKTQPRQRFFLDSDSMAVTNQCIYLTLNTDAQQSPPLIYFLTLLNSSTLQFFILHRCGYDQQGRMRLFRDFMASIPFQDRDVKNNPERTNQGLLDWIRRGGDAPDKVLENMKDQVQWMLGLTHGTPSASQSSSMSLNARLPTQLRAPLENTDIDNSTGSYIDTGADTDDNVEYSIPSTTQGDSESRGSWITDDKRDDLQVTGYTSVNDPRIAREFQQDQQEVIYRRGSVTGLASDNLLTESSPLPPNSTMTGITTTDSKISNERDRIVQVIQQAIMMIELIQWAVDQYGYMLYEIRPKYQKLLESELKLVYGSVIESLVVPISPRAFVSAPRNEDQKQPWSEDPSLRLGIELYRWDGSDEDGNEAEDGDVAKDVEHFGNVMDDHTNDPLTPAEQRRAQIPSYAPSVLKNAQAAIQNLQELLERYPGTPSQ